MGAMFDRRPTGRLELAREGGHSLPRVVHAGGAATGAEIERALVEAVRRDRGRAASSAGSRSTSSSRAAAAAGVAALGADGLVREVRATHVLLATGGAGQLFAVTTNPLESTGDGLAMALRAGVAVRRHRVRAVPSRRRCTTRRCRGRCCPRRCAGHGALLRDAEGRAVRRRAAAARRGVPRDHGHEMLEQDVDHLWLDATGPRALRRALPDDRRRPPQRRPRPRHATGFRSRPPRTTTAAAS